MGDVTAQEQAVKIVFDSVNHVQKKCKCKFNCNNPHNNGGKCYKCEIPVPEDTGTTQHDNNVVNEEADLGSDDDIDLSDEENTDGTLPKIEGVTEHNTEILSSDSDSDYEI